eukprot:3229994-Amphidinium_carterae.1
MDVWGPIALKNAHDDLSLRPLVSCFGAFVGTSGHAGLNDSMALSFLTLLERFGWWQYRCLHSIVTTPGKVGIKTEG